MTARAVSSFLLPSRIPFVCLSVWRTAKLQQRLPNHGEHKLLPHQHDLPSSDSDERLQSDAGLSPAAEIHSGHIPICPCQCSGTPAPKPVRSSGIVSSDSAGLLPPDCQMNHWKHHQLFLRFRKAACSSRNLPGIGNRTGFVLRIPSFSGRKSGPIVKASDFRQRLLLFLFILHFFVLKQHIFCFSESIPPVPLRCAISRQHKMEKCGKIRTYM